MNGLLLLLGMWFWGCDTPGSFPCGGKALQTVSSDKVCDGVIDCWGGQDERGDDCTTSLAYCSQPEPKAILRSQTCNGIDDCGDNTDEADCH